MAHILVWTFCSNWLQVAGTQMIFKQQMKEMIHCSDSWKSYFGE